MPLNSKPVRQATRVMVDAFADLLKNSQTTRPLNLVDNYIQTATQVDTIVEQYIESLRRVAPELPTEAGWSFLRQFCRASFELMKHGEDPGAMLSQIFAIDGESHEESK